MTGEAAVIARLSSWVQNFETALETICDQQAIQAEQDMKNNAPWIDRTANARNSLGGTTSFTKEEKKIILRGGMPYSPRLELDYQGRYAVIYPTAQETAIRLHRLVGKIRS